MIMKLRNVNYEFIEVKVQNLKKYAEVSKEVITLPAEYVEDADDKVYVGREDYDKVRNHPDDAVVQLRTVEAPKDTCPDCGEEFKDVSLHIAKSDCERGDEE